MAEKLADETGTKSGRRKKKEETERKGLNTKELEANLKDYFADMDKLNDDLEKFGGEIAVDKGKKTERVANATGYSRKLIARQYRKHRRALKDEIELQEMAESERDQIEQLEKTCQGMKGTPLFRAAQAKLEQTA